MKPDAHDDLGAVGRRESGTQLLHLEGQEGERLRVLLQSATLAGNAARGRDVGVPGSGESVSASRKE